MLSKIAAIQMTSTTSVQNNLQQAEILIKKAAAENAKLLVLPEMFPVFGDKLKIKEKYGQGMIQDFLSMQAKTHQIWIVGGTIPLESHDPRKIYAASLVFDDQGKEVARYDKIHLFDAQVNQTERHEESKTTVPGNQIAVIDTPVGRVGLSVCYDIRFPELYRKLRDDGAEIIAIPSAFTVPTGKAHWQILARARAIENFCYVIGACQGGKHENGRETYGHSLIIDPWGEIISQLDQTSNDIILGEIDLDYLRECRSRFSH